MAPSRWCRAATASPTKPGRWEQATANAAIRHQQQPDVSGSFRIRENELEALGLPAPVSLSCPGQHPGAGGRVCVSTAGSGLPGRQRLALYGWNRPYPFLPLTW